MDRHIFFFPLSDRGRYQIHERPLFEHSIDKKNSFFREEKFFLIKLNVFHLESFFSSQTLLFIVEEHQRVTWWITNKTNFIRFICYWFLSTSTCLFLLNITRIRLFFCSSKWRHFNGSFIKSMVLFCSINDQMRQTNSLWIVETRRTNVNMVKSSIITFSWRSSMKMFVIALKSSLMMKFNPLDLVFQRRTK